MSEPLRRTERFRVAVRKFAAFEQAITAQWQAFEAEAKTGLSLEIVPMELSALEQSLFADQGMRDGSWDVAFVNTDWIAAMHEQGCAIDLAPMLADDPPADYPHGWEDALLRLQRVGDQVLGVPFHDGPECLIYRCDLFGDEALQAEYRARFGVGLQPPTTWGAFRQQAEFFHRPEQGLYGTVFAAYPDGHNNVYDVLLQLWSRGGELFDPDGALQFETPQAAAALDFYRSMLRGPVHPASATLDSVAAGLSFAAGEVALMVNWFGFAAMAHTAAESRVRGLVDVAPVPAGEGNASASLNVYWLLSIAAGSAHPQIAWRFLKHVLSPAMDKLTTMSGAIGCRRSTWIDADVNREIPFYHRLAMLHTGAREIPARRDWPAIASIIDTLTTQALETDVAIEVLLREAQEAYANR